MVDTFSSKSQCNTFSICQVNQRRKYVYDVYLSGKEFRDCEPEKN